MEEKEKILTEVKIKLATHNKMFYTYAVLNKDTDIVNDYQTLDGKASLQERLEKSTEAVLAELEHKLNNDNVIYAYLDKKIISTKEIKEVLVFNY